MTTELLAAAEELKETERKCVWSRGDWDWDEPWESSCDELWVFEDVGEKESPIKYCPNCGGKIEVKWWKTDH